MYPEGVSNIVYRLKPHVKEYFDDLINDCSWETQTCHSSYEYPAEVTDQQCWPHLGVFYDYLIRRELHVLLGYEAIDNRAEMYKSAFHKNAYHINSYNREVYEVVDGVRISIDSDNIDEVEDLLNSYEIYKNTYHYKTKNVLKHIFNTAMLHMMSYGRSTVQYDKDFINWYNVKDVLNFVRSWNLWRIDINPTVRGQFFVGDADVISHDAVMDFKVSKYDSDQKSTFERGIYQMMFYALGYFNETGRKRTKFEVYNPLLGVMDILHFPDLDFYELQEEVDCEPCWEE